MFNYYKSIYHDSISDLSKKFIVSSFLFIMTSGAVSWCFSMDMLFLEVKVLQMASGIANVQNLCNVYEEIWLQKRNTILVESSSLPHQKCICNSSLPLDIPTCLQAYYGLFHQEAGGGMFPTCIKPTPNKGCGSTTTFSKQHTALRTQQQQLPKTVQVQTSFDSRNFNSGQMLTNYHCALQ